MLISRENIDKLLDTLNRFEDAVAGVAAALENGDEPTTNDGEWLDAFLEIAQAIKQEVQA